MSHESGSVVPVSVAVTGASGDFARTFIARLRSLPNIRPTVLVDLDLGALAGMLDELSYQGRYVECGSAGEVAEVVRAGGVALTDHLGAEFPSVFDVLVEATGDPRAGFGYARAGFGYAREALEHGRHVVMVSKEVDAVAGRWLAHRAAERGVRYLPARGDQPANLCALVGWVRRLGLEVVAAGKSSEYDVVFDPATGTARYLETTVEVPELTGMLDAREAVRPVLESRRDLLSSLPRPVAADLCEMSMVSQRLGIPPDAETPHYPLCRVNELADVYSSYVDGGLLGAVPALDVFTGLRLPNEASFAGGVFVVVRAADPVTWSLLAGKGHVVSQSGRYACLYWPFHLMGVETPLSVYDAVSEAPVVELVPGKSGHIMGARAARDLPEGHQFRVTGHHHQIDGVEPVLYASGDRSAAPFYLLDGATLRAGHRRGERLRLDALDGLDEAMLRAFQEIQGTSAGQRDADNL